MNNQIKSLFVVLAIVATTLVATTTPSVLAQKDKSNEHFNIGFADGCNGQRAPGPHTADYNAGFAAGQAKCGKDGGSDSKSSSDSASSSTSSSQSNGNTMHVTIGR